MPSKSKKQARLMRAVAHGWKPSRIKGPTRAVAREFVNADKRSKKVQNFNFGGVVGPQMYGRRMQKPMGALSRDPRAMPPQISHTTGGGGRPAPRTMPQKMTMSAKPMGRPDPRSMPPVQHTTGGPGRPMPGGLGQAVHQMIGQRRNSVPTPPGRRMVPLNRGGGNPMMGRRNPMIRQTNRYRPMGMGRGATSYFR
jgi:hypothetical protein